MKLIPIFVGEFPSLYAVQYDGESQDEFNRLFDNWNNLIWLETFFDENKNDLKQGYYKISVEDAVVQTMKEARWLENKLIELADFGQHNRGQALQTLFSPLDNRAYKVVDLQKSKGKRRWLRIYAIRIAPNLFVVSGGAIKLTLQMEEREHTKLELVKLEKVRQFLKDNQLLDETDFEMLQI